MILIHHHHTEKRTWIGITLADFLKAGYKLSCLTHRSRAAVMGFDVTLYIHPKDTPEALQVKSHGPYDIIVNHVHSRTLTDVAFTTLKRFKPKPKKGKTSH